MQNFTNGVRGKAAATAAAAALCSAALLLVIAATSTSRISDRSLLERIPQQMRPGAQVLTVAPDVAEWIYNNEDGNQDGTFGPDGGWVPWQVSTSRSRSSNSS